MKTFKDLKFEPHNYHHGKQAVINFDNNYGVSVIFGTGYSNGINNYELAVLYDNELCYTTKITNNVLGWQSVRQITNIMKKLQKL